MKGAVSQGTVLDAVGRSPDQNWIQLSDGAWVMIKHPELGQLIEPLTAAPPPPSAPPTAAPEVPKTEAVETEKKKGGLKKEFAMQRSRKACGANLKSVDADGASRDSLFDHLCVQAPRPPHTPLPLITVVHAVLWNGSAGASGGLSIQVPPGWHPG